jgi:hypothetical protein
VSIILGGRVKLLQVVSHFYAVLVADEVITLSRLSVIVATCTSSCATETTTSRCSSVYSSVLAERTP